MKENNTGGCIPVYQVDAFTHEPFRGNPAAVCLLPRNYEDNVLQAIAAEMNLSETAFLSFPGGKPSMESRSFSLRWFTPETEVMLCGHATLATAAVLFYDIGIPPYEITFETKSGRLTARREKNGILLDFPAETPVPIDMPKDLIKSLGVAEPQNVLYAKVRKILLVHLENEESVKRLKPNFELMKLVTTKEDIEGVIVTSSSDPPYDFISRYFAPWVGVNEDPVTGVAHTILTPYWSGILGKKQMLAYQASARGGRLIVRLSSTDRVYLIGKAVIVLKGELYL
jgi:PhzF family phenazine biosynthesis protein